LFYFKAILPQVPQGIDKSKNQNKIACCSLGSNKGEKSFSHKQKQSLFKIFLANDCSIIDANS